MMNRTRISLFYLGSYLAIIGFGLLFVPHETLMVLQSDGDYGDVFPRVAGMLMSGLGLSIFGMIRARRQALPLGRVNHYVADGEVTVANLVVAA